MSRSNRVIPKSYSSKIEVINRIYRNPKDLFDKFVNVLVNDYELPEEYAIDVIRNLTWGDVNNNFESINIATFTKATAQETFDTCLRGTLKASFADIVKVFGEPHSLGSFDEKTRVGWRIRFDDDTVATIYDYKNETPIEKLTYWSIGGFSDKAIDKIQEAFGSRAHAKKD